MRTKNIKEYVFFGRIINHMRFTKIGWSYHAEIKNNIKGFIRGVDSLNLTVTSNSYSFANLLKFKERFDKTKEDYKLNEADVYELTQIGHRLRELIDAELTDRKVFIITQKRMNVEKLLDGINDLFAPNIFNELPDLACFDFSEGAMCIAFDRATAAGFHVLRGMEGILRWFFDILNNSSGCMYNWGPIITNLRNLPNPPPKEILDQSDAIRVNYRNPTAHPDMRYDIENVQDLLSECIAVCNRIVKYLKDEGLI